jgi:uncharacterized protein (DUF1501 family)
MSWLANNPDQAAAYTRRQFMHRGLALASAAVTVPHFLQASAFGLTRAAPGMSSIPGVNEDRVLVVVQLSGGNDGLNTVVPFASDAYRRVRPGIALGKDQVHALNNKGLDVGLHPALDSLKALYDDGLLSIAQGVGYPNPNRSHFKSMDIWHTADTSGTGDGWLGRYVDHQCCGFGKGESGRAEAHANHHPEPAVAIGREAPLALQGGSVQPVSFESADLFRWLGSDMDPALAAGYDAIAANHSAGAAGDDHDHPEAAFLTRTALDARVASDTIRRAVAARPLVDYPRTGLAQQLSMVGSMIRAGMKTRVFYVSHGSFDTHAGQGGANGRHAQLLREWADALRAFYADLKAQGNDTRVLTMSFSEFGRRVGQNASGGTDHGTAAPMFLFGPMVRPGVFNDHPSLTDLDDGDLKFTLDFRSIYADILDRWLQTDSAKVLEARFRATQLIRA